MTQVAKATRMIVDGHTRFCLAGLAVLMLALLVSLWATGPNLPGPDAALGGTPAAPAGDGDRGNFNAGGQRLAILAAIEATNQKLDKLIQLLESGKLKVIVANPEKDKGAEDAKNP